jgi:hypothetical protein
MINEELESEIKSASNRIETRGKEIDAEIKILGNLISKYTTIAWTFVWIGAGVTLFAVIYFICKNIEVGYALNLLGDFMAGTVASIWSLAGLFFIYVAFIGQKQQLLNQQLEIMYSQLEVKYTRLELSGQKEEMSQQNSTLKQQKFENTFFQLIAIHTENVKSIDLRKTSNKTLVIAIGRDCFENFYVKIKGQIQDYQNANLVSTLHGYLNFYDANKNDLEHYFRHIYHILKFVDNSKIENKRTYTNFLRAQLSSFELANIFYNGLSTHGDEKMKPLLEKYALLKNLNKSLVLNTKHLKVYKKQAYGE